VNIEQAIEILEQIYPSQKEIATGEYPDVAEALDFAMAALRARQERENPKPLTLEQLHGMGGKPVWIVEHPEWGHWELSEDAGDYFEDRDEDFYGMRHDDPTGRYGLHVLGWLAYDHEPKETSP